ncbi:unnamed protein product [Sphenostylis stenocarpa]|uniref:Uncharacterized protein n=1 Tax=Sphenostylis stenocarpa TaxID=92480 RepID=A0AA86S225_9FABA|nr:unnamed protein product [Sphenostylis stenocarpa]
MPAFGHVLKERGVLGWTRKARVLLQHLSTLKTPGFLLRSMKWKGDVGMDPDNKAEMNPKIWLAKCV